ncbi:hypothetical protein BASA81_007004 [Batrachochytrium salamandrivorans]|nr:hypothetical protein BASA81_007004 [Batrachochytrium salamandrivorans]
MSTLIPVVVPPAEPTDHSQTAPADCSLVQLLFPVVVMGTNCCDYGGVGCINGRIVDLSLKSLQLTGALPSTLSSLDALQNLYLQENRFTGPIPSTYGNFARLQNLWMFSNQLNGSIPKELGNLKELQSLHVENNQLSGSIPSTLTTLPFLYHLYFSSNHDLTGPFPSGGFASLNDCNSTGTSVCLDTGYIGKPCSVPLCHPVASTTTSSSGMDATGIPSTAENGAKTSPSSSVVFTDVLKFVVGAVGVFLVVIVLFLIARRRKRAAMAAAMPPISSMSAIHGEGSADKLLGVVDGSGTRSGFEMHVEKGGFVPGIPAVPSASTVAVVVPAKQ